MTREELLRHARAMYEFSQTPESVKSALEKEFPELKESEDVRIIQFFTKLATDACGGHGQEYYEELGLNYDKVMTWLESKKEQKPVISDEAIRDGVVHFGITQYQIDNWLKKHINVVEQKPSEWSKEEKERIRQNGRLDVCYNPEKYGLCHKVEWSDEDERLLNIIIDILDREEHNGHLTLGELKACVKLLKSLHPIWKPNEEQLQPLEYAIDYFKKKGNDTTYLESLLNDLNKL